MFSVLQSNVSWNTKGMKNVEIMVTVYYEIHFKHYEYDE